MSSILCAPLRRAASPSCRRFAAAATAGTNTGSGGRREGGGGGRGGGSSGRGRGGGSAASPPSRGRGRGSSGDAFRAYRDSKIGQPRSGKVRLRCLASVTTFRLSPRRSVHHRLTSSLFLTPAFVASPNASALLLVFSQGEGASSFRAADGGGGGGKGDFKRGKGGKGRGGGKGRERGRNRRSGASSRSARAPPRRPSCRGSSTTWRWRRG